VGETGDEGGAMSPAMSRPAAAEPLRTVFISDLHLGYRGCQAEYLLDFLTELRTDELVLVGDVLDLWSLKKCLYWPISHQAVLRQILRLAREGTKVVYVPGNHDEECREFCGAEVAGIQIRRDFIHETATGKRYLVLHGDDFDAAVTFSAALKGIGEWLYDGMLWLGGGVAALRRRWGFGYWSLASWVKQQVPDARRYIERVEQAAVHAARKHGLDGVICGHIHRPGIRDVDGIRYCNDGDWVEHCTALVEERTGELAILHFAAGARVRAAAPGAPAHPGIAVLDSAA